jgi:hypothetical protein
MEELVPHKADLSSLQIIGQGQSRRKSQQKSDIEVHICGKTNDNEKEYEAEITDNIQIDDDDKENELEDLPDIADAPIMGKFNSREKIQFIYILSIFL